MLVPDHALSSPGDTRSAHHIARDCHALRRELDALYHQADLPPEDYEELLSRIDRVNHMATVIGAAEELSC